MKAARIFFAKLNMFETDNFNNAEFHFTFAKEGKKNLQKKLDLKLIDY